MCTLLQLLAAMATNAANHTDNAIQWHFDDFSGFRDPEFLREYERLLQSKWHFVNFNLDHISDLAFAIEERTGSQQANSSPDVQCTVLFNVTNDYSDRGRRDPSGTYVEGYTGMPNQIQFTYRGNADTSRNFGFRFENQHKVRRDNHEDERAFPQNTDSTITDRIARRVAENALDLALDKAKTQFEQFAKQKAQMFDGWLEGAYLKDGWQRHVLKLTKVRLFVTMTVTATPRGSAQGSSAGAYENHFF